MEPNAHGDLSLSDLASVYRRRRQFIYRIVFVFALLSVLYCLVATRRYEATSTIQVQGRNQDGLGLESMMTGAPETETDALTANINVQTQAEILQSDTLALNTINELHLEDTQDFQPRWKVMGWITGLFSSSGAADPAHATLENSPQRRRHVLLVFNRFLTVKPVNGTSLIEISYLSSDPKLAAAVVNSLTQGLMNYSFVSRVNATKKASGWLNSELSNLRQQSEQLEKQVADAENKSGVYALGTVDPKGNAQSYAGIVDRLQQAETALGQAEQNRIMRGAIAHAAATGDADMLADLAGSTAGGGGAVNNSLVLIQNLRAQQATQQAALQQAEVKYDESYPKLNELRGNIAGLQHSIDQEIGRLKGRAQADFDVATSTEAEDRAHFNSVKAQANLLNDNAVDLAVLRQEADQSRKLYMMLLGKFNEAGALEGLEGSKITVVDPGRVPAKPKKPNVPLYIFAALVVGFVLGCCGALVIDTLDRKIVSIGEVEHISDGNLIGVTPSFLESKGKSVADEVPPLRALSDPRSPFVEAVRAIRTSILLRGRTQPAKVILVTSSLPGEGKTTLSVNLAVLLAQSGKKVLFVDTDLREGSAHNLLDLPSQRGLSDLLAGVTNEPNILPVNGVPNLYALQAGGLSKDSSELLGLSSFAGWVAIWKEQYDHIVMDSTALLPVTDSLSLTPFSDVTLLIARPGLTEKAQLERSYQLLTRGGMQGVAAILNGLPPDAEGYSTYFGSVRTAKGDA